MEPLDFRVVKSKEDFHKNYTLHDKAIEIARPIIEKWGFEFEEFGEDRRFEKIWEKGKDKPDHYIIYEGQKIALIDWKGKNKKHFKMNKRAYDSYLEWSKELGLPIYSVIVIMPGDIIKIAELPQPDVSLMVEWDKNITANFKEENLMDLEEFKERLLSI